jgi:signal transduction histidine kinase
MPIARRIVDAHGGHICAPDQPSVGAEFVITLPRTIA